MSEHFKVGLSCGVGSSGHHGRLCYTANAVFMELP